MSETDKLKAEIARLEDIRNRQALHITHLVMQIRGKDWHAEINETRLLLGEALDIAWQLAFGDPLESHEPRMLELRKIAARTV